MRPKMMDGVTLHSNIFMELATENVEGGNSTVVKSYLKPCSTTEGVRWQDTQHVVDTHVLEFNKTSERGRLFMSKDLLFCQTLAWHE